MAKKTKRKRCIQEGNHGEVWQLTRWKEIKRKNKYDCAASRLSVLRNSDAIKGVSQAGRKKEFGRQDQKLGFAYFEFKDKTNFQWNSSRQLEILNMSKPR